MSIVSIGSINGVPMLNVSKVNGVAVTDIAKLNGVSFGGAPVQTDKVAVLPAGNGDGFSTPDAAILRITGDQSGVVRFSTSDLTATKTLLGRYDTTTSNRAFIFYFTAANVLTLYVSDDGLSASNQDSNVIEVGVNQVITARFDYIAATGTVNFFVDYADGFVSVGGGSDTLPTSMFAATTPFVTGGRAPNYDNPLIGDVHLAQLWDGAYGTGTLVAEFQPDQSPDYGTLQTWPSAATGEQWTGQGNARISAVNELVLDTFTDTNGTLLTAHTPDVGGPWLTTTYAAAPAPSLIINNSNEVTNQGYNTNELNLIEAGASDVVLSGEFTFEYTSTSSRGIFQAVVRAADGDNCIWMQYFGQGTFGDVLRFYERIGGVDNLIITLDPSSEKIASGTVLPYQFIAEGSTITAVVGEISVSGTVSSALDGNTLVGSWLRTTGSDVKAQISDFLATSITDIPI